LVTKPAGRYSTYDAHPPEAVGGSDSQVIALAGHDRYCKPSVPVSVIIFHETADRLVPFEGGSTPFQIRSRRSDAAVSETVAFWAKQDGCSPLPKHEESAEVRIDNYSGCRCGTEVELYAIQSGRRMWPGTG
jgi:polyhydroxybutyrate depolymerase